MKIKLIYRKWKQVKKQLGLVRLEDKVNYKGDVKHSYALPLYRQNYPRFHFETRHKYGTHEIDIHIDWIRHTKADSFHPLIDELVEKINNIK